MVGSRIRFLFTRELLQAHSFAALTRSLVIIHLWIKIVRAHQPWSNLYNCAQDWNWIIYLIHDLQNILYYIFRSRSSIYDWIFATAMHVSQIVCVCYSTVNVGKCKQQVTELLLHMITIKFWNFYFLTA
jgi:hypothetical protein